MCHKEESALRGCQASVSGTWDCSLRGLADDETSKRLWEEVEVLRALNARGGHANVLDFVDGWDEDDHLFIQTSLCAMGNLATFLNEYGRLFDRLGEAQVWKIVTDVADVSEVPACHSRDSSSQLKFRSFFVGSPIHPREWVHPHGHQASKRFCVRRGSSAHWRFRDGECLAAGGRRGV